MEISLETFKEMFGPPAFGRLPGKYTSGENLSVLLTLVKFTQAQKVLEMFCNRGDTAAEIAATLHAPSVFAGDVCRGLERPLSRSEEVLPMSEVGSSFGKFGPEASKRITAIAGDRPALEKFYRENAPYDLVYVDGNHTWRGVADDTKLALELVRCGGTVVWDDYWYCCPDVMSYIDLLNRRVEDRIVFVRGTRMCYVTLPDKGFAESLRKGASDL